MACIITFELPLNYLSSDGGKKQFLLEMYLRFGTEFMIRAFGAYGSIKRIMEPELYISDILSGGRPFVSLKFKMLMDLKGETALIQVAVKNTEDLYFLDWNEPDIKVTKWKDFFDQLKHCEKNKLNEINRSGSFWPSLIKVGFYL